MAVFESGSTKTLHLPHCADNEDASLVDKKNGYFYRFIMRYKGLFYIQLVL